MEVRHRNNMTTIRLTSFDKSIFLITKDDFDKFVNNRENIYEIDRPENDLWWDFPRAIPITDDTPPVDSIQEYQDYIKYKRIF